MVKYFVMIVGIEGESETDIMDKLESFNGTMGISIGRATYGDLRDFNLRDCENPEMWKESELDKDVPSID